MLAHLIKNLRSLSLSPVCALIPKRTPAINFTRNRAKINLLRTRTIPVLDKDKLRLEEKRKQLKIKISHRRKVIDYHGRPDLVDRKGERFRRMWLRPKRAGYHRYWTRWLPETAREFRKTIKKPKLVNWSRPKSFQLPIIKFKKQKIVNRKLKSKMRRHPLRRYRITPDMDWPSHWPLAKTYNAEAVPLPIRMEFQPNPKKIPRDGFANIELLKIPNFLHLTPVVIKRQCAAIKQFFTPFPEYILSSKISSKYFPLKMKYSDFVHQSMSLRDIRSRVITLEMKDAFFEFKDIREKTKFTKLCGYRYNEQTRTLSFVIDRCFTRKQNMEYAEYLITTLYNEVKRDQPFEKLKTYADNITIDFKGSSTEERLVKIFTEVRNKAAENKQETPLFSEVLDKFNPKEKEITKEVLRENPKIKEFSKVWQNYMNQPETPETVREYARSTKKLFGIPEVEPPPIKIKRIISKQV